MNRRQFSRRLLVLGAGSAASAASRPMIAATPPRPAASGEFHEEPARKLPVRKYDVVVAGGGTAGVVAALAAARCAARRCGTRDLPYGVLRDALTRGGVYFET